MSAACTEATQPTKADASEHLLDEFGQQGGIADEEQRQRRRRTLLHRRVAAGRVRSQQAQQNLCGDIQALCFMNQTKSRGSKDNHLLVGEPGGFAGTLRRNLEAQTHVGVRELWRRAQHHISGYSRFEWP
jgi:hypothetical protein